jgi:hypothetical protein
MERGGCPSLNEPRTRRRRRQAGTVQELNSIAMLAVLVGGFEAGILFTLMPMFPPRLNVLSYLMLSGVVLGTFQRRRRLAGALT